MAKKNSKHGQAKGQTRNVDQLHLCFVSAWIIIVQRYICFKGNTINDESLAFYFNNKTKRNNNIIASEAVQLIWHLAKIIYEETDTKELSKYSCYSLQVGACCSLYAGFNKARIKKLLRWKSNIWMDSVRDMIVTTIQHNKAMNSVVDMPLM